MIRKLVPLSVLEYEIRLFSDVAATVDINPRGVIEPEIVSFSLGDDVPIPTLPLTEILILSV